MEKIVVRVTAALLTLLVQALLACIRERITQWWPAMPSSIKDGEAWCTWPYFCHAATLQEGKDDRGDSEKGQEALRVGGRTLLTAQSYQKSGRRAIGFKITSYGYAQNGNPSSREERNMRMPISVE